MSDTTPRIVLGVTHAGSLKLMAGLPERFVAEGWEVHIVSDDGPETSVYQNTPIFVHRVPMSRKPSPIQDLNALRLWVVLLKKLAPDVVFVGTPKAGLLGIVASWLSKVPRRVYHLRGLRLESSKGVAFVLYWLLERMVFSFCTGAVAVSNSLRQRVIDMSLVSSHKVTMLGYGSSNGVDVVHFEQSEKCATDLDELGLREGVPVIGFVGRITNDKGSYELAAASRILGKRGVKHQLLFVGPEEDPCVVREMSLSGGVQKPIFTGRVPDTAPYYNIMALLCLPTHREGFPNVVLEAAASGVPTVTTNATGAIDSVLEGVTGHKVPVGDSEALADVLGDLLANPEKREKLGMAAKLHAKNHFLRTDVQARLVDYLTYSSTEGKDAE